jgi:hypothetical protein
MTKIERSDFVGLVKLLLSLSEKYKTTVYLKLIRPMLSLVFKLC